MKKNETVEERKRFDFIYTSSIYTVHAGLTDKAPETDMSSVWPRLGRLALGFTSASDVKTVRGQAMHCTKSRKMKLK